MNRSCIIYVHDKNLFQHLTFTNWTYPCDNINFAIYNNALYYLFLKKSHFCIVYQDCIEHLQFWKRSYNFEVRIFRICILDFYSIDS